MLVKSSNELNGWSTKVEEGRGEESVGLSFNLINLTNLPFHSIDPVDTISEMDLFTVAEQNYNFYIITYQPEIIQLEIGRRGSSYHM